MPFQCSSVSIFWLTRIPTGFWPNLSYAWFIHLLLLCFMEVEVGNEINHKNLIKLMKYMARVFIRWKKNKVKIRVYFFSKKKKKNVFISQVQSTWTLRPQSLNPAKKTTVGLETCHLFLYTHALFICVVKNKGNPDIGHVFYAGFIWWA